MLLTYVDQLPTVVIGTFSHLSTTRQPSAQSVFSALTTRLYGARGILVSGDCKQESGLEHVQLIKTAFDASQKTHLRTVSIASDGESRRGLALVQFTFKKKLSPDSPIYDQLTCLPMMNLEVGDDVSSHQFFKHTCMLKGSPCSALPTY